VKKPVKAVIPAHWGTIGVSAAAQPGNRPGRGKSAHVKKHPAKKPAPKIAPGWFHPAVQAAQKKSAAAKKAKKAKHHPKRQLALGEGVACCSAEALAASLRLAGRPAGDDDVLELYWRTADDADAGASILATLEAAARFGLAGVRPASFAPVGLADPWRPLDEGHRGVILGLDLPGPHAVLDDGRAWWSWGNPYDPAAFPDAVIEEAWEVTWHGTR
jgi:hypothetical protein